MSRTGARVDRTGQEIIPTFLQRSTGEVPSDVERPPRRSGQPPYPLPKSDGRSEKAAWVTVERRIRRLEFSVVFFIMYAGAAALFFVGLWKLVPCLTDKKTPQKACPVATLVGDQVQLVCGDVLSVCGKQNLIFLLTAAGLSMALAIPAVLMAACH